MGDMASNYYFTLTRAKTATMNLFTRIIRERGEEMPEVRITARWWRGICRQMGGDKLRYRVAQVSVEVINRGVVTKMVTLYEDGSTVVR